MAAISLAAGTAYSAYSAYEQGQNQAAIARYNADQQRAQNQFKLQESANTALAERQENERILAEQANAFAANGAVIDTGSPLLIQTKQAALLERRALKTDYEGAIASRFGQGQVTQYEMHAKASKRAVNITAGDTLLKGAASAAGQVANYKLNS